jgi:hypothetical protein
MLFKQIVINLFLIALVLVVSALAISRTVDLFDWFLWWSTDRTPITSIGVITKIYEYRGRDSGKQRIHLSEKGRVLVLHSVFEKPVVEQIADLNSEVKLKYYPTPTGSRFIFFLSANKRTIYNGLFRDSGWPGVLMVFVCVFYYAIIIFSFKFLISNLRLRS